MCKYVYKKAYIQKIILLPGFWNIYEAKLNIKWNTENLSMYCNYTHILVHI